MKILFCGLKYDNGNPKWGLSFEYQNFFEVLKHMEGVEARMYPIDEKIIEMGRDLANQKLIEEVENTKPDLLFCLLFTEEVKKETIKYITEKTKTKTFNWFADDHWRFPTFSRHWAPLFTKVSTTDSQALEKYKTLGINNVIKTQWAANTYLYKKQEARSKKQGEDCQISFVGKKYGKRGQYIETLKNHRLSAEGYGGGWPGGRVSFEQMLEIFSCSKINLNFTESYLDWPKEIAKLFVKKESSHYKLNLKSLISNLKSLRGKLRPQIKGRTFEVPACGGFLLTGDADNLKDYYVDGKEIVIFKDKEDLVEKCKYYLSHEEERQAIAKAGYERTIKEHTYEQRFREIFRVL